MSGRGRPRVRGAALASVVLLAAACAAGMPAPAGAPVADPQATAAELQRASLPDSPRQASFSWELNEAGSRLQGRGVVRYEAPERLRLDLFGPRGETYLAAALVGDSFRIPGGAEASPVALPSPALLWGALGVVRPPTGAQLVSATTTDQELFLRYSEGEETFEFRADAGELRLRRVERLGRGGVLESVQVSWTAPHRPEQARYRDVVAYRELVLTTEEIRDVPSFPGEIWRPVGADR